MTTMSVPDDATKKASDHQRRGGRHAVVVGSGIACVVAMGILSTAHLGET
jgi:hypothetical protein